MGGGLSVCCNNPSSHHRSPGIGANIGPSRGLCAGLVTWTRKLFGARKNKVRTMGDDNVASLIGSPALNQLVDKVSLFKEPFSSLIT